MEYEDPKLPLQRQPNEVKVEGGVVKIYWFGNKKLEGNVAARYGMLELTDHADFSGRYDILVDLTDREDPFLGGVSGAATLEEAINKIEAFVRYKEPYAPN